MNQHLVARDFEELLTMYGLSNHVTFPTHTSGSSLDPVTTDLPDGIITCRPLGMVGSSDHSAVLTTINTAADNDEATTRVNWLWSRGDWDGLRNKLDSTEWTELLQAVIPSTPGAFPIFNFPIAFLTSSLPSSPCTSCRLPPASIPMHVTTASPPVPSFIKRSKCLFHTSFTSLLLLTVTPSSLFIPTLPDNRINVH
ncbi:hypothetical protein Pcinc_001606 [Petrolisthes cinctipes]|uniref:Endonuclease/exonuclease/phosphatase domain-containing protein n=1 Tax=Petrolisthes cinctipes TaxID=88211 RepID=A0AAE1GJS0_PETCI|nr:hypothetical protein Pcinc_001606 [Petrolisthes cinctipes]